MLLKHLLRNTLLLLFLTTLLISETVSQGENIAMDQQQQQKQPPPQEQPPPPPQQQQKGEQGGQKRIDESQDREREERFKAEKARREELEDDSDDSPMSPFKEENPFNRADIMLHVIAKPKEPECVYHLPNEDFRVYFQIKDGPKVVASVRGPGSKELYHEEIARFETGFIEIDGKVNQPFEICVFNTDSWKKSIVSIEIGHPDRVATKPNPSFKYLIEALQGDLKSFRLKNVVLSIQRSRHTKKMERNLSYITYWSLAQTALMIFATVSQVMLVRSLFDEKSVISKYFWSKK